MAKNQKQAAGEGEETIRGSVRFQGIVYVAGQEQELREAMEEAGVNEVRGFGVDSTEPMGRAAAKRALGQKLANVGQDKQGLDRMQEVRDRNTSRKGEKEIIKGANRAEKGKAPKAPKVAGDDVADAPATDATATTDASSEA